MGHEQLPVGRRVVVRSVVAGERGPSGGPALTDIVGMLEYADEQEVVVRRRDGSIQRVPRADILIVKVVPLPPPPRPSRPPPQRDE